jgi:hypothetical protein
MPTVGTTLRLHFETTHKQVWLATDEGEITVCDFNPGALVTVLEGVEEVRLLGSQANAELICWLYQARSRSGFPLKVQLGSPGICKKSELVSPELTLGRFRDLESRTSSTGGWHSMTDADLTTYLLICALAQSNGQMTDDLLTLMERHPARKALSFIPSLNLPKAAVLLAHIIDPRWYVNPRYPDRSSNLKSRLGLVSQNMLHLTKGTKAGINARSSRDVVAAWGGRGGQTVNLSRPEAFLQRCQKRQSTPEKGLLRTSHLFVRFVSSVWLQQLSKNAELFVPEYFFEGDDEEYRAATIQAYRDFVPGNHM